MTRTPLSPVAFDAKKRQLEARYPNMSATSGRRSRLRNKEVGGRDESKHLIGMAQDYAFDDTLSTEEIMEIFQYCKSIGLWYDYHNVDTGFHLHTQGLPPGPIDPDWWSVYKYVIYGDMQE